MRSPLTCIAAADASRELLGALGGDLSGEAVSDELQATTSTSAILARAGRALPP
jgi:hypothetical protein